jgi:large subunit ribosomal protein L28
MSRKCSLTGKKGMVGNKVSHSQRKTKRVQQPNILTKRLYIPEENRTVTVRLSARALRTLNKKGIKQFMKEKGLSL